MVVRKKKKGGYPGAPKAAPKKKKVVSSGPKFEYRPPDMPPPLPDVIHLK